MSPLLVPQTRIVSLPGSGGGGGEFTMPILPNPVEGDVPLLEPNFALATTGKCPYRPWVSTVSEGIPFFANGFDAPWMYRRDLGQNVDLGTDRPTEFSVALDTAGTGYLAPEQTRTYYICRRDPTIGRETAPQILTITNGTLTNENVVISQSASSPQADLTHVAIYRDTEGSGTLLLVTVIPEGSLPYTDSATDESLAGNRAIVQRQGITKPPRFIGLATYENSTFGWTGEDSNLYYSQQSRTDGEFVTDDFVPIPIQVGPLDGYGPITGCLPTYTSLVVFKRRAAYEVLGDALTGFTARLLFDDRGCLSARSFVGVDNFWVFLDEQGLMLWTPGAEPVTAAADPGTRDSAIADVWARINRDAAHLIHLQHDEVAGVVLAYVPLDEDPVPTKPIVYDYRRNVYVSIDDGVALASGRALDASGREHRMRIDDLGLLWETGDGNSEGVYAGSLTDEIAVIAGSQVTVVGTGLDVTLDGVVGAPYDVYDSDGEVVAENRVARAIDGSNFQRVYADGSEVGDDVAFGVIPAVANIPRTNFGTSGRTTIARLFIDHAVEMPGSLISVDTLSDESPWARKREVPLDDTLAHSLVSTEDNAFRWEFRIGQRYPSMDFSIFAFYVEAKSRRAREK